MNYDILKAELVSGHPVTGVYDIDDAVAATQLNVVNCTRSKDSMTGSEILNAIDKVEYVALLDADKDRVWQIVHLGTINPFGIEVDLILGIFGAGSATIIALQTARQEPCSRAAELELETVFEGTVQQARAM